MFIDQIALVAGREVLVRPDVTFKTADVLYTGPNVGLKVLLDVGDGQRLVDGGEELLEIAVGVGCAEGRLLAGRVEELVKVVDVMLEPGTLFKGQFPPASRPQGRLGSL